MNCSMPGFLVIHHLLKFAQTCPLSWWCHPTISPSVVPFFSWPQSFPESGTFPMSQLFASGGQSIGASALVLPMNIQGWVPLGLTGLISLLSKGLWRVFSNTRVRKHQFFRSSVFMVQLSHPYMTTGKTIALTRWIFVSKVTPLLFNMLSRFVIAFLPRSKCLLSSWLQSPFAVILEPKKTIGNIHLVNPWFFSWVQNHQYNQGEN